MRLAPGTRVGPYEILAPLGAGGMGEVYRARDSRLARDVALKALPARVAEDPKALARFEREAQAIAALSHPNILAIFDYGHTEGVAYAVTELLEGESLRERLKAGPLAARKAAEYAAQVAHGLAAAHEKGIVHRDLKPENLFLTRDGWVKVLDFGLARVSEAGPLGSDTGSPTEVQRTEPGTVVGTVVYMSPEQVRGKVVDHRSDIFSLGSVLQELATGQRAFQRETAAETMAAILKEDPLDAPERLSRSGRLDPGLERIVRHCLEKGPEERFQSARDLAFALEALTGGSHVTGEAAFRISGARSLRRVRRLGRLVAAVLAALGLVGLGVWIGGRARAPSAADVRQPGFTRLTFQTGDISQPSVSPEGQSFAFVGEDGGDSDIFVQRIGGTNPINLTSGSSDDDSGPAFSPDGAQIAFQSSRGGGGIFVMGATGESVRRLTDSGDTPAWSPDGREIVYSSQGINPIWPYLRSGFGELWAVNVATGAKRRITRGAPMDAVQPSWSPHAQRIAYWGLRGGGQRDLWTVASSGAEASGVDVTNDPALDWNPVWAPDGRFLYFASDRGGTMGLWRVAIDEASGRTRGSPEAISVPTAYACGFSFTRDGAKLLLSAVSQADSIERAAFDPALARTLGEPQTIFASALWLWASLGVSSDGRAVAFSSTGQQEDLYTIQRDGTGLHQLTNDAFKDRAPIFFPGGDRVLFYSNRSGQYEAWSVRLDGSHLTQLTRTSGWEATSPTLSPDGARAALRGRGAGGSSLLIATISGTEEPVRPEALPDPGSERRFDYAAWSRDGRRLAGLLLHSSGRRTLALHVLGSSEYQDLDMEAEIPIAWLAGDRDVLFLRHGKLMTVELASRRAREVVVPAGSGGGRASDWIAAFDLSQDRKTLFVLRSRVHGEIWQITTP